MMPPRPAVFEKRIRALAADTGNIDFTTIDALRILRSGHIDGEIVPGRASGEWKCKLTKKLEGRREAGVVVVVINNQRLSVKTIEWEDWKG